MEQVTAYKAFAIYASYDGEAPDTSDIVVVATEELAQQLCSKLNENPEECKIVYVNGYERYKSFAYNSKLVEDQNKVYTDFEEALAVFNP